jgi:hypothetical protein
MKDFDKYDKENPEVWAAFERITLRTIDKGFKHYSAKGVFELVRWHTGASAANGDGLKVNNNYTASYSRKFMEIHPLHDGFFRKRDSNIV